MLDATFHDMALMESLLLDGAKSEMLQFVSGDMCSMRYGDASEQQRSKT